MKKKYFRPKITNDLMNDKFALRASEWDSSSRIKMTDQFVTEMLRHIQPEASWKALEIGAGTGLVGLQIAPMVNRIVFEDTSEAMLKVLQEKLPVNHRAEILNGEIGDYKKQDIDLIFSCMAFHHIPDTFKTLQHIATITKPGARVIIGDLATEDGSFHDFEPIPHQGFDTEILSGQFRQVGFEVITAHVYNVLAKKGIDGKTNNFDQFILIARKND